MELGECPKFNEAFPDLGPASEGAHPLNDDGWARVTNGWNMKTEADYLKHVLTRHDGEMRSVGNEVWERIPASGGIHRKACFWQYQFATTVAESNQGAVIHVDDE